MYYYYITLAKFCENSNIVFSFFSIIIKTLAASVNLPIKFICCIKCSFYCNTCCLLKSIATNL